MKTAIVIGSGIGGISAALRLRAKGYEVDVYEANHYAGGKLTAFEQDGYRFDAGPSLFTMPNLVEDLFRLFDRNPTEHFSYRAMDTVCHYFWEDGTRFNVSADPETFIRDAAITFDEPEDQVRAYLADSRRKYDRTEHIFLEKSLHTWSTYLNLDTLRSILAIPWLSINTTLDAVNRRYFTHPKLVQLFNRYATYNGSSPYRTPGIMSMIPHLEMSYGTFYPEGGMHSITQSLVKLAEEEGIRFHFDSPVLQILHQQRVATGVMIHGEEHNADLIVSNMDIFSTYRTLLKDTPQPDRILNQERSSSALIFYWGITQEFPELDLHNIIFTNDYPAEFQALFEDKTVVDDPTVYINITSKEEPNHAPAGCENWFVMINAPGHFGQDWERLIPRARQAIIAKLNRVLQTDIEPFIATEAILDPIHIESRTQSHRGALYGASSNSQMAAFLRHPNFSKQLKNLYFCGGSVHPGGGIPLCILSGKIVADLIPDAS